jgi:hypothetical protein
VSEQARETSKAGEQAEAVAQPAPRGFWVSVAHSDAQRIAALTFLFLMLLGGVFVVFAAFFSGTAARDWTTTVLLRGADIISVMAASLLIFIVISARNDAILSLLGVLVIAAVIVPTQELARLAGLAGIGDGAIHEQAGRLGRASPTGAVSSQNTASRLVEDLDAFLRMRRSEDESQFRKRLKDQISSALVRYDMESLEAAVRNRALEHTLLNTLNQERLRQIALTPIQARMIKPELFALRDMGLVSLWQSDILSASVTPLGRVQTAATDRELPRPSATDPRCDPRATAAVTQASGASAPESPARTHDMKVGNFRQRLPITGREGVSVQIEVAAPTWLLFRTEDRTPRSFDPFLTLRLANGDVVTDDDSAGDLNARIAREVPVGNHQVILTDVSNGSGSATLEIRQVTSTEAFRFSDFAPPVNSEWSPAKDIQSVILNWSSGPPNVQSDQRVPRDGQIFKFDVPTQTNADFVIEATTTDRGADLEISLHRLNGDTATFLEYNDDSDRSFNSRITRRLESGTYLLRVRERSRNPTQATIKITPSQ